MPLLDTDSKEIIFDKREGRVDSLPLFGRSARPDSRVNFSKIKNQKIKAGLRHVFHRFSLCLFLLNTKQFSEMKTPEPLKILAFGGKRGIPPA